MEGKDEMEISLINSEEGEGKVVMNRFPLKGTKPNHFMVISGKGCGAEMRALIYN